MSKFQKIESVIQLNGLFGNQETHHPLVTVVDFSKIKEYPNVKSSIYSGLYSIMLKQQCSGVIKYGRQHLDFESGSLIFIAPGQVISIDEEIEPSDDRNWGLFFHPDLLAGTSLNMKMKDFSFFFVFHQ